MHKMLDIFKVNFKDIVKSGRTPEVCKTFDFMKSGVIAPSMHPPWRVFAETSEFVRFWVDFTWNPPDFKIMSFCVTAQNAMIITWLGHRCHEQLRPSGKLRLLQHMCGLLLLGSIHSIYKVLGGFHLKSAGFHVKSKEHLQGIVTLCYVFSSIYNGLKLQSYIPIIFYYLSGYEKGNNVMQITCMIWLKRVAKLYMFIDCIKYEEDITILPRVTNYSSWFTCNQ